MELWKLRKRQYIEKRIEQKEKKSPEKVCKQDLLITVGVKGPKPDSYVKHHHYYIAILGMKIRLNNSLIFDRIPHCNSSVLHKFIIIGHNQEDSRLKLHLSGEGNVVKRCTIQIGVLKSPTFCEPSKIFRSFRMRDWKQTYALTTNGQK